MNEDAYKARKFYAGEKKPSMHRRNVKHDYLSPNIYMLTMATEGRVPLFGKIAGSTKAKPEDADYPHIVLSPLGAAVYKEWQGICRYYPQIKSLYIQMMPDHLHGILQFMEPLPVHLGQVVSGFKAGCNRAFRAIVLHEGEEKENRKGPGRAGTYKTEALTKEGKAGNGNSSAESCQSVAGSGNSVLGCDCDYVAGSCKQPKHPASRSALLFEEGYNDKILYGKGQLDRWFKYLKENPYRLMLKREHRDLFRVQFDLHYGPYTFSAIGNRFLLSYPNKLQLQCSRRLTTEQIEEKKQFFLKAGREGAVVVSPAISKGEKTIMRALLDNGCPLILLQENGFTYMSKPSGSQFMDACANGKLLILSPWQHHNERRTIQRNQCMALNEMAKWICQG